VGGATGGGVAAENEAALLLTLARSAALSALLFRLCSCGNALPERRDDQ
jgi:hypothetical protein